MEVTLSSKESKEEEEDHDNDIQSTASPSAPRDLEMAHSHSHSPISSASGTSRRWASIGKSSEGTSPVDHARLRQDLHNLTVDTDTETDSVSVSEKDTDSMSPSSVIKAFTEEQLKALFSNEELDGSANHLQEFLRVNLDKKHDGVGTDLAALLQDYHRSKEALREDEARVDRFIEHSQQGRQQLWKVREEQVEEEGECQDMREVVAKHTYPVATFHEEEAAKLRGDLRHLRRTLLDSFSVNAFKSEMCHAKIEDHLFGVLQQSQDVETMLDNVALLFAFLRKPSRNEDVVLHVKGWLDRLVSPLLRRSEGDDFLTHLNLLHQILRCPPGVGKWAAKFVQVSLPSDCVEDVDREKGFSRVRHLLTIVSVMMSPIKRREDFLKALKPTMPGSPSKGRDPDELWSVMDHEGDEDEDLTDAWHLLSDDDLVALFDQIPFDAFFKFLLRVGRVDGDLVHEVDKCSDQSFMQLFAIVSSLVRELRKGFETFNRPRYRSFARRICHVIRESLDFVSEHWQAYRDRVGKLADNAMLKRIQVEYDAFFLRVIRSIFSAHELGTWQYFAYIPYGIVSMDMLWRVFFVLHLDYHDGDCQNFAEKVTGGFSY